MSKYEGVFSIPFGQIKVSFDDVTELEQRLKDLNLAQLIESVSSVFGAIAPSEPRKVKPALEGLCRFREDGLLEFYAAPKTQLDGIGIVLFAFDPDPVDVEVIRKITGAENPVAYLGNAQYKRFFDRTSPGQYRLSHPGRIWITEQVLPQLKKEGGRDA